MTELAWLRAGALAERQSGHHQSLGHGAGERMYGLIALRDCIDEAVDRQSSGQGIGIRHEALRDAS
jgi:hypothetical protein